MAEVDKGAKQEASEKATGTVKPGPVVFDMQVWVENKPVPGSRVGGGQGRALPCTSQGDEGEQANVQPWEL